MPYPLRSERPARRPARSFLVALAALAAPLCVAQRAADEVRLVVTVTDGKGRYLVGLDRSHFSVLEGKAAREITAFEGADAPASVGIIVDVSGSMMRSGEAIRLALGQLVLKGHPENEYFIAEFNTQGRLLTDWTRDAARLEGAIRDIGATLGGARAQGNTALYDAFNAALARLTRGAHAKQVLVVVSDGQDNYSRTKLRELRRQLQESEVLVYCLGLIDRRNPGAPDVAGQAILAELATPTGGAALFPEGRKETVAAGEWIAAELRHQYVVAFAPGAAGVAAGPAWRKIKIKVAPPSKGVKGVSARSREGYFFPRPVS